MNSPKLGPRCCSARVSTVVATHDLRAHSLLAPSKCCVAKSGAYGAITSKGKVFSDNVKGNCAIEPNAHLDPPHKSLKAIPVQNYSILQASDLLSSMGDYVNQEQTPVQLELTGMQIFNASHKATEVNKGDNNSEIEKAFEIDSNKVGSCIDPISSRQNRHSEDERSSTPSSSPEILTMKMLSEQLVEGMNSLQENENRSKSIGQLREDHIEDENIPKGLMKSCFANEKAIMNLIKSRETEFSLQWSSTRGAAANVASNTENMNSSVS